MLERKSEKQNSQVKANKERNLSQIELNAEKRRLLQEANQETNLRTKLSKYDLDAVRIYK